VGKNPQKAESTRSLAALIASCDILIVGWFCTNCFSKSLESVLQAALANKDVESPKMEDIINFFKEFLYDMKAVIKNVLFIGFCIYF
jgi:hypothetical protein